LFNWRQQKYRLSLPLELSEIRAVEFTASSRGDSPMLPELLGQNYDGETFARLPR
jgi:hypothetical protein